jgi:hypothetical protein
VARPILACALAATAALAIAACGSDDEGGREVEPVRAIAASGCTPISWS